MSEGERCCRYSHSTICCGYQVGADKDLNKPASEPRVGGAPQDVRGPVLIDQCVQTTGEAPGVGPPTRLDSRITPTWVESSHPIAGQATSPQQESAETIRKLAVELAACECRATSLAEENNRLMAFSCKLRAAWEQAVVAGVQNNRVTCGAWFGSGSFASGFPWRDHEGQLEMVLQRRRPSGACRVQDCAPEAQWALPSGAERMHPPYTHCEDGSEAVGDAARQLSRCEVTQTRGPFRLLLLLVVVVVVLLLLLPPPLSFFLFLFFSSFVFFLCVRNPCTRSAFGKYAPAW